MKIKRRGGSPRLIANGQAMMSRLRLRQNRFADAIEMAQLAHEERAARLQPSSRAVTSLQEIMAEALMGLERRAEARRIMEDLERVYDIDGDAMDRLAMTRLEAMLRFHEGDAGNARLILQDAWSEIESLDRARSSVGQAIRRNLDMIEAADEHHENKLPERRPGDRRFNPELGDQALRRRRLAKRPMPSTARPAGAGTDVTPSSSIM